MKDQFGINWYQDPVWSIPSDYDNWGGVTCTGGSGAASSKATIPATSSTVTAKTFRLQASRGDASSYITVTVQPTYMINYDTTTNGGAANSYTAGTQVNTSTSSTKVNFKIPSGNKPAEDDGWVFNGWATNTSATSGVIPDGSKTIEIDNYNDTIYATYKKTLTVKYHYFASTGAATKNITKDIYNHASSGTVTAQQVTDALGFTAGSTKVTMNGVEYTFQGWRTDTNNSTGTGLSTNGQYAVQANDPTVDRYAVYTTTNTGHLYYYDANGSRQMKDVTGDAVIVNAGSSNKPTQASFTLEGVTPTTATIDGRTFTFVGWRADNTDEAVMDKTSTATETRNFKKAGYDYFAVYAGDLTVSYNLNERFSDGSDDVTGTVASNKVTQYAVADTYTAANAKKGETEIPVNPSNIQLTRVGADQFLGWRVEENGADTESEEAQYGVTDTITIDKDTVLTAVFMDSRKTVTALYPDGSAVAESQTIRYNYGGRLPYLDKNVLGAQVDGSNHYYFNGWTQNNALTDLTKNTVAETVDGEDVLKDYYDFSRVKDHVTFTASYTAQTHHWQQDDLATSAVACNGVAGEGHAFTDGGYHRYCTECGYGKTDTVGNYSDNTYVTLAAADVNGEMILNNRPATCTAKGSTGKTVCKFCFQTIKEAQDVDPLGVYNEATRRYEHDLQPVEAPAGATYTLKRCTVCGHEERYYNADEHTLVYVAKAEATCEDDGYTQEHFYCEDCGKRFAEADAKTELNAEDVVIPALGHNYEVTGGKAPTCTEDGYGPGRVCTRCGKPDADTEVLPATGHPEAQLSTEEGFEPTCTKAGKEDYVVCGVCGEVLSGGEEIPALGHDMTGIRVDMPSCTEAGKSYRYCQREGCDVDPETEGAQREEIVSAELPALGHDMKLKTGKAATCTEAGVKDYYECARCGRTTEDAAGENAITNIEEWRVIEALDHDLGEPETVAPTCTEAGYTIRKCSRCTYTERTEGEPALGHTGGTATCKTKAVCDVCGKTYGNYGSHVWDEGRVTTEADCQHRQVTTYTCTVCGETKTEKGGYGDHDYWVVTQTAATCTAQGDVVRRCAVCGDETHELTDALGHDVSDWHMDGTVAKGTCKRCGQEVTTSPSEAGLAHKCEKCGLVHEGRTGIFVQDGLYCKIIGFFRSIFKMFGGK